MGFERNYQIRVPSKELHKKEIRFYSTTRNLKNETSLNPWFLTGFIDGAFPYKQNLIWSFALITGQRQYSKIAIQMSRQKSTSLVVWGTNLQSTVGGKFSRKELAKVH